jgi:hypothetical protein
MGRDARISYPFGDDEHTFRLAIGQLIELEEKRDAGAPLILNRLLSATWFVSDVREVIRLGLIGGGMPATDAIRLVKRYVEDVPSWQENALLATAVLGAALQGVEDEPAPGKPEAGAGGKTSRSRAKKPAGQPSTETAPS